MRSTGITRRLDDLGRIVIPKEVRKSLGIKEGDAMEIFTEDGAIILEKYKPPVVKLSEVAAKWVNDHRNQIISVVTQKDKTIVTMKIRNTLDMAEVVHHPSDPYDLNVAICYCAKKIGFTVEGF